jgi:hypothetical protein
VAKLKGNSASSPKKSAKQEAFECDAREKLEHADMGEFDRMIKKLVHKSPPGKLHPLRRDKA